MKRKRTCGRCPKFDRGWCVHRAEMRPPDAPSCGYDKRMMYNAHIAGYMREHYKPRKERKK